MQAAKRADIELKQTFEKEGKELRRSAGGYAHAKQFKRLGRTIKRQKTILGVLLREVQRKLPLAKNQGKELETLQMWLERATRIHIQKRKYKRKLPQNENNMKIEASISLRRRDEEVKVHGEPDCWNLG